MIVTMHQETLHLLFTTDPISRTPDMIPAAEVRSMNPVAPPFAHRYNIQRGADFRIACFAHHASTSDYTLEFYKDGRVIGDGDLPDTVLTSADPQAGNKQIALHFPNFNPEHNGVYYCNATLSSGLLPFILDEAADLFLYGTGKLCMRTIVYILPLADVSYSSPSPFLQV